MRRLKILYFWLFINKNNINFGELIRFLIKPRISTIAGRYIEKMHRAGDYEVKFYNINTFLYWPASFSIHRLDQVISETYDVNDWHFYQKNHTEVEKGEILLDIGTAEGLFPLTVIDKCQHIYMIERSQIFYSCLQKTFEPYAEKVTIYNTAVGNQNGVISFTEDSLDGMVSNEVSHNSTEVKIATIDNIIPEQQRITYLKADIEGFEEEMLRGAERTIKRNKPKIAITTYHMQNDPADIISIIKGFVPEYKYYVKGIYEKTPKPVMIHFWI